jgi:hypothetical protein
VRAHLLLRADLQHPERAVVQSPQRLDRCILLQRFRGEEEQFLAELQGLLHGRVEHGHGLADAGRRGDEQRVALPDRAGDRRHDLLLPGTHAVERKLERVRERALGETQRRGDVEVFDELREMPLERGFDLVAIEVGVDDLGIAGDEVDQREVGLELEALEIGLAR